MRVEKLFPQLKFYSMAMPKARTINEPVTVQVEPEYDHKLEIYNRPQTALFVLSNEEVMMAHWPLVLGQRIRNAEFISFCHAQATYLQAQLFAAGVKERVIHFNIHTRKPVHARYLENQRQEYTYNTDRHVRETSVYESVLRGEEVKPYLIYAD